MAHKWPTKIFMKFGLCCNSLIINGASGGTRTPNRLIRSQKLYPIELPTRRATCLVVPSLGRAGGTPQEKTEAF